MLGLGTLATLLGSAWATPGVPAAVIGGAVGAVPAALSGISSAFGGIKRRLNPEYHRQQDIYKRLNVSPKQYELRRQQLQEGLASMKSPQSVFFPEQAQMQQLEDITRGLPQQVGSPAQAARPGSLAAILNMMNQGARSSYQTDLAAIGARRGAGRGFGGRTSGGFAMRGEALKGRATNLAQDKFKLLSNFANRNLMADMELGQTNLQRDESQNQLMNFLSQLQQQQQGGLQEEYLGQQGLNIDQANLQNILGGEQYQQGIRQFRLGQESPYRLQQPTQAPPQAPPIRGI